MIAGRTWETIEAGITTTQFDDKEVIIYFIKLLTHLYLFNKGGDNNKE